MISLRVFHAFCITLLAIDVSVANEPLLIASPYPFNTSKTSRIQCFSNDQSIVLSLTITARMLATDTNMSSLRATKDNVAKNDSIVLVIPALFNYSQLSSQIECRSNYYHGQQKFSQLEVFSVAEIAQDDFLSLNTYTNQLITIHCLTYGSNVFIHWDFSSDLSDEKFSSLPLGIRITYKFTLNDTLIIDHVSYSDHRGYYRCNATNHFGDITYEDRKVFFLNVKKSSIWIPIVIVCVVIVLCILLLLLCSRYCRRRRKRLQEKSTPIEVISHEHGHRQSEQRIPSIDKWHVDQKNASPPAALLHMGNEQGRTVPMARTSPQFVLGNPFLDPRAQPITDNGPSVAKVE